MSASNQISDIKRGTTEIINVESLRAKLTQSKSRKNPLRVKVGLDPTAPDIHLGHVVLLRKLRQFQDMGHRIFLIIGDFTAQIGDPSGRDKMRPKMTKKEIMRNAQTYKSQIFKILDKKKTKVVFNSEWLAKLSAQEILELSSRSTVAQMLARADFKKRFESEKEISILEFIYPLLQGYDSVHLKADIELGGSDQKFNLLMGRQLQESLGQAPQIIIMTPLLEGTDGVQKMSKSVGNYIGIAESPDEICGKIMSISDDLMYRYYELLTDENISVVKTLHPKEAKLKLAKIIIGQFYSKKAAECACDNFDRTFSKREIPESIAEYNFGRDERLADVLLKNKLVASKNEFRRLLNQGAISHEGSKVSTEEWKITEGVIKVGKRRFLKLTHKTAAI